MGGVGVGVDAEWKGSVGRLGVELRGYNWIEIG